MDWQGWVVFGLLATSALTAVLVLSQLAGMTRMDLPLLLGTLVIDDPDRARVPRPGSTIRSSDAQRPRARLPQVHTTCPGARRTRGGRWPSP